MDERPPIRKRQGRRLPHWTKDSTPNFVTMRLGDALPQSVVAEYKEGICGQIKAFEARVHRPATSEEQSEIRRRLAGRIEKYLDAGCGKCLLRNLEATRIAQRSVQRYAGERYVLDAWCVVPNHVHLILTPCGEWPLEKITYDLKHGSSRLINRALGRRGTLWQNESFDHLIRNDERLERFRRYVLDNPARAGSGDWPFVG